CPSATRPIARPSATMESGYGAPSNWSCSVAVDEAAAGLDASAGAAGADSAGAAARAVPRDAVRPPRGRAVGAGPARGGAGDVSFDRPTADTGVVSPTGGATCRAGVVVSVAAGVR